MLRHTIRSASLVLLAAAALHAAPAPGAVVEAVKNRDTAALKRLMQARADVNAAEVDGTTALHWAVRLNDVPAAELLLKAGASVKAANRYGVSPLSVACTNGNAAIVKLLLQAGADPNSALPGGETALMSAARSGSAEAVTALIARGAEVNVKEDGLGQTALMWAASEGHSTRSQVLLEAGSAGSHLVPPDAGPAKCLVAAVLVERPEQEAAQALALARSRAGRAGCGQCRAVVVRRGHGDLQIGSFTDPVSATARDRHCRLERVRWSTGTRGPWSRLAPATV